MAKYSDELRGVARALYLRRYTPKEIASELNLPNARIIYYWAEKEGWADMLSHESTEDAIERRIQLLTGRDGKTELELKELDQLIAHAESCVRSTTSTKRNWPPRARHPLAADGGGNDEESDQRAVSVKITKMTCPGMTEDDLNAWAEEHLFGYQKHLRLNISQQVVTSSKAARSVRPGILLLRRLKTPC